MACPSHDRVLDYVERRLAADEREEIEQHVDGCADCRQLIAELARTTAVEGPAGKARDVERIGRYRIEARLGQGGMGTVYVAHDPQLDRRVAIKLVHPELATGDGFERLLREGRALARLSHPNIVAVHDAGSDGDRVYIAMELVDGEPLDKWLTSKPRTWREIVRMFVAVARGLAVAHDAGIVHRDVKPANVLIDRSGRPKVADFGLASSQPVRSPGGTPSDSASRITEPGAVMGTPAFMSPEQWRGDDVTPATDQYSLCAALRIAIDEHKRPKWLQRALDRGLAIEPKFRYSSMHALADALDPDRRTRRNRRIVLAIAAPLVIGGATAAVIALRPEPNPIAGICATASAERSRMWSVPHRIRTRAALEQANPRDAAEIWSRLDADVQLHHTRQLEVETALCGARPETALARERTILSLDCLATSRRELLKLHDALPTITAYQLRRGIGVTVPPPEECVVPALVESARKIKADAKLQIHEGLVQSALKKAAALAAVGRAEEAVERAKRAVVTARNLDEVWLLRALLVLADCAGAVDKPGAEVAFREAAAIAERLPADRLRAQALAGLMQALARQDGREREALALEKQVTALIKRVGRAGELEPMVLSAMGLSKIKLGQQLSGMIDMRAALDAARKVALPGSIDLIPYLIPMARIQYLIGFKPDGIALMDEAVRIATEAFGPNAPKTQQVLAKRTEMLSTQPTATDKTRSSPR